MVGCGAVGLGPVGLGDAWRGKERQGFYEHRNNQRNEF